MRVGFQALAKWVDMGSHTPTSVAALLIQRGIEVEGLEFLGKGLDKVRVVLLKTRIPHPQADRLSLCTVEGFPGAEALQIVCGATNMKPGDRVALAEVGAVLPGGLEIRESRIRGELSQGMLCSEEELGLASASEGIWILPVNASLGSSIASYLGREEWILEVKLPANRGDCASERGLARELVLAGFSPTLRWKAWEASLKVPFTGEQGSAFKIQSPFPYWGCWVEGVDATRGSPPEVVQKLEACGFRSVNAIVDATHEILLEYGQPTHAYDVAQIQERQIRVQQVGEVNLQGVSWEGLTGKVLSLETSDWLVLDTQNPLALAGVLGGVTSQVRAETQGLFLEAAVFHSSAIRRTQARQGCRTEASARFSRGGFDSRELPWILKELAEKIQQRAGGEIRGFYTAGESPAEGVQVRPIAASPEALGALLGESDAKASEIRSILENLGCQVSASWEVSPPPWRADLQELPDLSEELAKHGGYASIPSKLPRGWGVISASEEAREAEHIWKARQKARGALVQQGFLETVSLPFLAPSVLEAWRLPAGLPLLNPLQEGMEVLTSSLLPLLVSQVEENQNHHFGSEPLGIRFFQLRNVFLEGRERARLALVLTGALFETSLQAVRGEAQFEHLRAVLEFFLSTLFPQGASFRWEVSSQDPPAYFQPGQVASLRMRGQTLGWAGRLHPSLQANLARFSAPLLLAELDWDLLASWLPVEKNWPSFVPWQKGPGMERDFALWIPEQLLCAQVCQVALQVTQPLGQRAWVFDYYQAGEQRAGFRKAGIRVLFGKAQQSLQESEVEALGQKLIQAWKARLGVELRLQ